MSIMVAAWLLVSGMGEQPALQRFEQSQIHMGTQFRIVLYAVDEASASAAAAAAFARIADLDAKMSDYRDDSELTLLSRSAGSPPVQVSPDLFDILDTSADIARKSAGAFDVTAGPAVRLWRRARRTRQLPTEKQIAQALTRVGPEKMRLDREKQTVELTTPGMLLDLGGIAKGYACQAALSVLRDKGIASGLVVGGGDVVVGAPPPGKTGWQIDVAELRAAGSTAPARKLILAGAAVSTSGDASQFVELNGTRYSHIVDPKTGLGLTNALQATVIAPDAAIADALATAVCVLGVEHGIQAVERFPGAATMIIEQGVEKAVVHTSTKWTRYDPAP